jgi:uncharacterized protein YgbK (DUF1537 family)
MPGADRTDAGVVADPTAALPPPRREADARARIRAALSAAGRRIAVLDDDPTGSQTVHDVAVVTVTDADAIAAGLDAPGSTCFVLTNTRSMGEDDAVALTARVGRTLFALEQRWGAPVDVVSRSDSTLRGHVVAEVTALDDARRAVLGRGYDGVLLVPAFLEAGRFTAGDVHWARVDGEPRPVGETEFARDATFGFTASDLREFVAERSGGRIPADTVRTLTLDDIRRGGPERVAALLREVTGGAFVVVNAVEYADLDVVVLGALAAQDDGRAFLYRTGPSFPRALAGLDPRPPLRGEDLFPGGRPPGHGLVVVGSHVGLTSRQVARARAAGGLTGVELDVGEITAGPARRDAHVAGVTARVRDLLSGREDGDDVLLFTSRTLVRDPDPATSLDIARRVSAAVVEVVRGAVAARPAWVVAKGGITSHDVAAHGLGIRRATVLGQLFPGQVSVFRPVEAPPEVVGVPYVVFAGNVGDEDTLADVVARFRRP